MRWKTFELIKIHLSSQTISPSVVWFTIVWLYSYPSGLAEGRISQSNSSINCVTTGLTPYSVSNYMYVIMKINIKIGHLYFVQNKSQPDSYLRLERWLSSSKLAWYNMHMYNYTKYQFKDTVSKNHSKDKENHTYYLVGVCMYTS